MLRGSALAQRIRGPAFQTQLRKRRKSQPSAEGFFDRFSFSGILLCQNLPPVGPLKSSTSELPGRNEPRRAPRSCAPCRRDPGRPRYLDRAPSEAVDGVGICAGFQELPHRLHLSPRRGGGQARVTAAAQHALVLLAQSGPLQGWSSAGREMAAASPLGASSLRGPGSFGARPGNPQARALAPGNRTAGAADSAFRTAAGPAPSWHARGPNPAHTG